jgi:DNA recombination protein RmuC
LFKPDVIVRLPENKDVIIDSKVSLVAYERYCSTDDDQQRIEALKQHTEAVRNHIKTLSNKDYTSLKGLRSLDFVLLFMPIEAAFMAAFQADEKLFNDAFEHKIVVVTPTTLLATLRTIQNIWRYEQQNENARLLADKAGTLYEKIRGFVEDIEKLGSQLNTVHKTYDMIVNKLTSGNGNLLRQASAFEELGVKVKKSLPKSLVEQMQLDESDD